MFVGVAVVLSFNNYNNPPWPPPRVSQEEQRQVAEEYSAQLAQLQGQLRQATEREAALSERLERSKAAEEAVRQSAEAEQDSLRREAGARQQELEGQLTQVQVRHMRMRINLH